MSDTRRALCWFLTVVLLCTLAVIVTAEPGEPADTTPLVTVATAPDSVPVIYEENQP